MTRLWQLDEKIYLQEEKRTSPHFLAYVCLSYAKYKMCPIPYNDCEFEKIELGSLCG